MLSLKEEEFLVLQQYNKLLETIEEAFVFLGEEDKDLHTDTSKVVMQDSYEAIGKVAEAHMLLVTFFQEDEEALQVIADFGNFIDDLEQVGLFGNRGVPETDLFAAFVLPAFESWKLNMQKHVLPFIAH